MAGSQPSAVHALLSSQFGAAPPTQVPVALHASFVVQALPSSHADPVGFVGFEHTPVPVLQTPTLWHESDAVHVTGLLPTQAPPEHVSVWVHALLSLQPLVLFV
jgi:hypothetical protein